jgi:hypothetical protein
MAAIARIIALGASNLALGFPSIVSEARSSWGSEIQVLAALGHGRSYGAPSRVLFRTLPGILDSGLWRMLQSLPPAPTRALVTDVGNDILYGQSAEQILAWVDEALIRLQRITTDIILTDLPLASIQRLSQPKFLLYRSATFPSCRLSLNRVREMAETINTGLAKLANARGVKTFKLNPAWYGFDPIHIRPSLWRSAWRQILDVPAEANPGRGNLMEGMRLFFMPPELRYIFGIKQFTPQFGTPLPGGGRVWLY